MKLEYQSFPLVFSAQNQLFKEQESAWLYPLTGQKNNDIEMVGIHHNAEDNLEYF